MCSKSNTHGAGWLKYTINECVKNELLFFSECVNSLKTSGNIYNP